MTRERRISSTTPAAEAGVAAQRALLARATTYHRAGRLDEAEQLYRRILAARPADADALHLLGLVRHAKGDQPAALAAIDRAIRIRAAIPSFHVGRAAVLLAMGQAQSAARSARRALALDGDHAEAHNTLGNALLTGGDAQSAIESYRRAIALRPTYAEALSNLGSALRARARLDEAEAALREALRIRPAYASALANLGLVLQDRARWEEALDCFDRAIAADPGHATARGNRAMLLLLLGRLAEGFAEYEWRWRMPGFATPHRAFPHPSWRGEDLAGRTLFVHAEQGLGSAIQFARFAISAAGRGGRVILECRRPLLRLFRSSLARVDGRLVDVVEKGAPLPEFDCHLPLMSLPAVLGTTLETIPGRVPYLRVDAAEAAKWQAKLERSPHPRIGLVWAGNPEHQNDHNRSMPAPALAPLIGASPTSFFSLQVPSRGDGLAAFPAGRVVNLAPELGDFADTAAVVAALDLVVSVDTAAAHLAGALGRPVWLLLPHVPDWRWLLDREDSPWYPTMRIFRQQAPGDWSEPVDRVAQAIDAWRPGTASS